MSSQVKGETMMKGIKTLREEAEALVGAGVAEFGLMRKAKDAWFET